MQRRTCGLFVVFTLLSGVAASAQPPLASLVKDINTTDAGVEIPSSSPHQLTVVGNKIFFSAFEASSGTEVWASDGTSAGTELLQDTVPGADSPPVVTMIGAAHGLFFWTTSGGSIQPGFWRSDGTRAGTFDLLGGNVPREISTPVIAGN